MLLTTALLQPKNHNQFNFTAETVWL